ncbi:MAG: HD domain-containing protein [Candidatus Eremiobacteraeota bacterium]|nr:HD domain-containing protein [Candidatus Eremiobacteraeota bacterium]
MKRIFDPIHHFIELSSAEAKLLDSDVMQRMRRLRQLGLAYLAFPSAEHSRFSHALGALAAGTRVFETLVAHSPQRFYSESDVDYQRRLLRAALLLHDIGHGPFSHACEAVLGVRHEQRTQAIVELPHMQALIEALAVDPHDVLSLIVGKAADENRVLAEIVSGPNLDADRMDYLLRDAYFTGVATGHYDSEQLFGSLRVYRNSGPAILGVDSRGVVALESFVLARYMMFATVYFHHTTRMYERILQEALRELWPAPKALDDIKEFLRWDDARVMTELESLDSDAARALRGRIRVYALAAEFNAERDLEIFENCEAALRSRWGDAVWADSQEQLMHRLPLGADDRRPTVMVGMGGTLVDARDASDLIERLSGRAYWRKLFVKRDVVDVEAAREICRSIIQKHR